MNNNCHDNKIKKILEEGKKCNCTPITVTNSGTNENVILNFTIPRGEDGATGPIGATGPTARCNKSSIYIFKW